MSLLDRQMPTAMIGSSSDMDELLIVLRAEGQKPAGQRRWKTLVVDTFDAYQRTMINERLTKERRERFINEDWGWLGTKTSQLLERISNLAMHVVINLHVKDVTEGEGDDKVVKQKPHLKGDVRDQIAAEFDLVGYMETYWSVEGDNPHDRQQVLRRRIQWEQDQRHPILKDCSGQLGTYTDVDFTEDDFQRIWEPIFLAGDRLDKLPESQTFQVEVPVEQPAAAPTPPIAGGAVASPAQAAAAAAPPAKKAAPPRKATKAAKAAPPAKAQAAAPPASGAKDSPPNPETPPAAAPAAAAPQQQPDEQPPVAENPPSETATPVASQEAQPAADSSDQNEQAVAALAEGGVTGDVVSDEKQADPSPVPPQTAPSEASGPVCGDGLDTRKFDGCGKDLSELSVEHRDRAELAFVRWRVRLCDECFPKAKAGQLTEHAA